MHDFTFVIVNKLQLQLCITWFTYKLICKINMFDVAVFSYKKNISHKCMCQEYHEVGAFALSNFVFGTEEVTCLKMT